MPPLVPSIGEVAFGFNVHYHVPAKAEDDDIKRRGGNGGGIAFSLLLSAGALVIGAVVPWRRLFGRQGTGLPTSGESC